MARKVFPSNPNTNDIFTSTRGKKFQWNGKVWKRTQDTNVESMTLDSSADEKLALHGSDNPTIRFREGSNDKGNLHWKASTGEMRLVNEEYSQELRLGQNGVTVTGNLDVTGNLEVTGTTTFNGGTLTLGDSATDNVVFGADVNSSITPNTDDAYDLGSSSKEWRNLYIDGTANIDTLSADSATLTTADIDGGTVDGATIGGSTPAAGTFTTLVANGDVDLGDATSDTITATGRFDSDLVPSADGTYDLGSSSLEWNDLYIDGTANIDTLNADSSTLTTVDINGGDIDGTAIGGSSASTGAFTTLSASSTVTFNGNVDLGNATSDTITATGRFDSDLVPSTDSANALGTTALRWSNLFIDAATVTDDVSIGGNLEVIGNANITGTLTYEDVTNIDSVGVVTARSGLVVSSGGANITGGITGDLTGAVTGNADTATTLATSRTLSISGAGTGSASFNGGANADIALTLANSGVTAGTYGSSSAIPSITVDAKGLITSASTTAIDSTSISNGGESVSVSSGGQITSSANHDFDSGIDVTGNITVTGTVDGRDVASDGSKLDGIASGAQVNVATNLSVSTTTTTNTIASSTGTNATIGEATGSAAGLMSTTHHNKLDGIASGATNVSNNNQLTNGAGYITSSGTAALAQGLTGTPNITVGTISCGNITSSGTVTANSDAKLKKNVATVSNALDKVNLLRGVEFDYIANDKHSIGVIAQEVEAVLPDLVEGDETKSVAYGNLTAVLIEAVKELTAEVNTLKAELNTLKGE